MGIIGSNVNITSGCQRHQAKKRSLSQHGIVLSGVQVPTNHALILTAGEVTSILAALDVNTDYKDLSGPTPRSLKIPVVIIQVDNERERR